MLVFTNSGFSQNLKVKIETKLTQADSVLIVSHEATRGESFLDKKIPTLLENKKLNYKLVHEKSKLSKEDIDSLIQIFRSLSDTIAPREDRGCFNLHHAIVIFENQTVSFIDLSFECENFLSSSDLDVKNNIISFETWTKLKTLFLTKKVQYLLK